MSSSPTVIVSYISVPEAPPVILETIRDLNARMIAELEARGLRTVEINAATPEADAAAALASADGVVVMGGLDVDPSVYGEEPTARNLMMMGPDADRYEVQLVQGAVQANKPVFGVCRGIQLINVAMGGTLIQDLGNGIHVANTIDPADPRPEGAWTNHPVSVTPDSRLAGIVGEGVLDVRVGHHQAVDRVGDGLTVAAQAIDGVVEAVEGVDHWILGLQWHPEEEAADPVAFGQLMDGYASAVQASAVSSSRA